MQLQFLTQKEISSKKKLRHLCNTKKEEACCMQKNNNISIINFSQVMDKIKFSSFSRQRRRRRHHKIKRISINLIFIFNRASCRVLHNRIICNYFFPQYGNEHESTLFCTQVHTTLMLIINPKASPKMNIAYERKPDAPLLCKLPLKKQKNKILRHLSGNFQF